jgi:hypothetical protein
MEEDGQRGSMVGVGGHCTAFIIRMEVGNRREKK